MSNPSRQVALLSALVLGVNALLVAVPANAVTVWGQDWQTNGRCDRNRPDAHRVDAECQRPGRLRLGHDIACGYRQFRVQRQLRIQDLRLER